MNDGWIKTCNVDDIEPEDVIRFDHGDRTFAIYRTNGRQILCHRWFLHAPEVHLAGGFVMDNLIECPKHNGRFDFTTGQAKGAPVCVDLKTYPIKLKTVKFSSSSAENSAMKIFYFRSVWGLDDSSTLEDKLEKIKSGGFDGVELDVPLDLETCQRARQSLDDWVWPSSRNNGGRAGAPWPNIKPASSSNTNAPCC